MKATRTTYNKIIRVNKDALAVLALGLALGLLLIAALGLTYRLGEQHAVAEAEAGMAALLEGYDACQTDRTRTTACELEYDGDGSTALPQDWDWYWR